MPFDPYADFRPRRRLDRAIRVMMLACAAALGGVIAGGAGVFAVVSVLTAPPPHRAGEGTASTAAVADIPHAVANAPAQAAAAPAPLASNAAPNPLPNSWPDALTRASHQPASPPQATPTAKEVATTQAPPLPANEQKTAKPANEKEVRAVDTRPAPAGADNRVTKPLYGYAPQPYGEPAKQRSETTARDTQPSARDRADWRYRRDAREDAYVRPGFFGRDEAQRDWSSDGTPGFDEDADDAPPPGFRRPPRNVEQRWRSGRQVYSGNARPQWRPGGGEPGYDRMNNLIGDDEWVGDWRH